MTAIRIGLMITMLLGLIYAFSGLLTSLTDFGIGMAVLSVAAVLYGLCTYIAEADTQRAQRFRDEVWARRDREDWQ